MRLRYLWLFLLCLPAYCGTVNPFYNWSDFTSTVITNRRVTFTPLQPSGDYSGSILSAQPTSQVTDGFGICTFSNVINGYSYRVQLFGPIVTTTITNFFPSDVTGSVNGADYQGQWIGQIFAFLHCTNCTGGGGGGGGTLLNGIVGTGTLTYTNVPSSTNGIRAVITSGSTIVISNAYDSTSGAAITNAIAAQGAAITNAVTSLAAAQGVAITNAINASLAVQGVVQTNDTISRLQTQGTINTNTFETQSASSIRGTAITNFANAALATQGVVQTNDTIAKLQAQGTLQTNDTIARLQGQGTSTTNTFESQSASDVRGTAITNSITTRLATQGTVQTNDTIARLAAYTYAITNATDAHISSIANGDAFIWDATHHYFTNGPAGSGGSGGGDFFADGHVPMSGALDMGVNDIIGCATLNALDAIVLNTSSVGQGVDGSSGFVNLQSGSLDNDFDGFNYFRGVSQKWFVGQGGLQADGLSSTFQWFDSVLNKSTAWMPQGSGDFHVTNGLFSAGFLNYSNYIQTNINNHAYVSVGTNSHIIRVDQFGTTNKSDTNGYFSINQTNGNYSTFSNGNLTLSGNATVGSNVLAATGTFTGGTSNYIGGTATRIDGTSFIATNAALLSTVLNPFTINVFYTNTTGHRAQPFLNYSLTDSAVSGSPCILFTNLTTTESCVFSNNFALAIVQFLGSSLPELSTNDIVLFTNLSSGSASAAIVSSSLKLK